jgi:hypothetical protein
MADRKISDLTALTTPASGDYLPIVDISEAAAASKNKSITLTELFKIPDAVDIETGTSTGTKIGTATTQKLGFWDKTPVVQPTTGISGATFDLTVAAVFIQHSTFDGYTIAQVVAALRQLGNILA